MAKDLQTLKTEWQACAVSYRIACERLKRAELAYRNAHLLAKPDAGAPDTRVKSTKSRPEPAGLNPYPGA